MDYAIFLRGVNVNGISIKMKALKQLLTDNGFENPRTILASGNVIVSWEQGGKEELQEKVSRLLEDTYHYDAHVIVKSKEDMDGICKQGRQHFVDDGVTHYILLMQDGKYVQELEALFNDVEHPYQEMFVVHDTGCYWMVEKGHTLDTPFGKKVLGSKKYKAHLTSRNMNTLYKVAERMA